MKNVFCNQGFCAATPMKSYARHWLSTKSIGVQSGMLFITKRKHWMQHSGNISKTIMKVMKLTTFFLTVALLNVSAKGVSQTITFSGKSVGLKKVFTAIEEQTGMVIFYNNGLLEHAMPVTLTARNMKLTDFLEKALREGALSYEITNKMIVITEKSKTSFSRGITSSYQTLVSGTIFAADNNTPLPGASIKIKGTAIGTNTDNNGKFSIKATPGQVLIVSYIGYLDQEIIVKEGGLAINVILEQKKEALGEVVVVAYGTQRKETVTGAISAISTKEIKQSPAANLAVNLAGRLPGLTTVQNSGEPGQDVTNLYLRGQRTLNGQAPLIMVDGVPRDLTYIDPNEVESVTILKDASSTAMFGVRGANGVILVTTRRGTSEKPQISFSSETGIQQFNRLPDPVHSWELAEMTNQAWMNDGQPAYSRFSEQAIEHYRKQDRPDIYPDNDWLGMLSRKNTMQQRFNLNVSGRSKAMRYFVNVGHLSQNGLWKTDQKDYNASSSLKRYNFRSNIDVDLNKTLTAFLNVAGYMEQANAPNPDRSSAQLLYYTYIYPATMPGPLTPDGQVLTTQSESNPPWAFINRSGYTQEKRTNVTASYGMEQKLDFITQGLSAKIMASFDVRTIYNIDARQSFQQWIMDVVPDENGVEQPVYSRRDQQENTPLDMSDRARFFSYFNVQGFLNYSRSFGDHAVTGLLLYQQDNQTQAGDRLPYRVMGIANRITYGFKNKYFAEFNGGYNGSEQFASHNRFGFFPSFSASWVISKEKFLQNNPLIHFLKIRGSYGKVGNDRLGGARFLYLDNINLGGGGYNQSLYNGQRINEALIGNSALRWEVSRKTNVGIEFGLFNQLDFVLDVFKEKTDNMLINRQQIPKILGLSGTPPVNMGIVDNHGYEIEVKYRKRFNKDLSLLVNANYNYAANKLIFNDEPMRSETFAYRYRQQGYPIGQQFGYLTDGFWNSAEDIAASGLTYQVGAGQPRPGDLKYIDVNKDKVIDEKDMAPILYSPVPQHTFGGAISVNYRNFDFSLLFQGVSNVSKTYTGNGIFEIAGGANVFYDIHRNAWTPERAANGQKITYPALGSSMNSNHVANQFFIWDASYLRLKNFEIGYSLSTKAIARMKLQQLRVYANALNPITWDRMPTKAYDPEISWVLAYPIQRVFNFGINVIF